MKLKLEFEEYLNIFSKKRFFNNTDQSLSGCRIRGNNNNNNLQKNILSTLELKLEFEEYFNNIRIKTGI